MMPEKTIIRAYDDRRNIVVPGDKETTLNFCVKNFFENAFKAIRENDFFSIALSGGSTPKAIFEKIATSPQSKNVRWDRVFLFWSDERSVPPEDPQSNYAMAMKAGFASLPIPKENVFRMQAEDDTTKYAKKYEEKILMTLKNRPFDFIMLGVGEDGHTASLFPKTHALQASEQLVASNYVPEKETWRMTLTFKCINEALQIVVYALGKDKAAIVKQVLGGPYDPDILPAQRVGTASNKALWILDDAAASFL